MASAKDGQMKQFCDFMKETEEFVDSISSLVSKVSDAVDKLYAGVEATSQDLIKQSEKVRAAYQDLKFSVECARRFVEKVEALIRVGGSLDCRTDTMIASLSQTGRRFGILWKIPNPNFEELHEFLEETKLALSDVEDAFLLFKESINIAIKSTNRAALECEHFAMKAGLRRDKTKITGAITTTGLTAAAGFVGGVLLGPVGAILGATAVGSIGSATTIGIAQHYENQRQAFYNQLAILNGWLESANSVKDTVTNVHRATGSLAAVVDKIQNTRWRKKHKVDVLCHDIVTLSVMFSKIHKRVKDCSKSIHTASKKIDSGLAKHHITVLHTCST